MEALVDVDDIRLTPENVAGPERDAMFAALRAHKPVSWHPEPHVPGIGTGPGFWALTRYADVWHVSRHPQQFISGRGSNITDLPPAFLEFYGSMINMDAPRHTRLRHVVQRGFTPRTIARVDDDLRRRARAIVDRIADRGSCELVEEVSAALPLGVICDMMGIPAADERRIYDLSNVILGAGDPEFVTSTQDLLDAGLELSEYAQGLRRDRLAQPRDDITTALVHAEVDGERLTPAEFGSFFILLVVAGNETTRNAITHGVWALTQFPDQRAVWLDDLDGVTPTAVEEIVRWATPVLHFRRTATEDAVLGGQHVRAGDKVVLWYVSANRDPEAFADPDRFDVRRHPNEHVGFGGGGPHFCLGANLARREIAVMFGELLRRLPDLHATAEPDRLRSWFVNGIKRLPVAFTPAAPLGPSD